MATEKIYYAAVILTAAVSVLLSPFFLVRRSRSGRKAVPPSKRQWRIAFAANFTAAAILLLAWYLWF
ncbi:Uncharacterised protein [Kingella potus]|uniref:Uncharacterized protein n=1 Tax=Kingella potus TaxID=265175 RepID=A0A377QZ65_9NEIS|nr:hypothetical protein [Kingella potus]UOP01673.1 hypothetical protein LVJ84_05895 [Kingella potus]STR00030.1 Uncharacterised protein [Kingella potus]